MLKWLATFLAEPFADLLNNSLATAVVPGDWKVAVICPVFKKGDPDVVANYRPLSWTSIVCKVFDYSFYGQWEHCGRGVLRFC